jgi:hypothetical protein
VLPALTVLIGLAVCAGAVLMMVGYDPIAAWTGRGQAVPFGQASTVKSPVTVHGQAVDTKVTLTVYAVRKSDPVKKHQQPVKVSVRITNRSSIPLALLGRRQELRLKDGATVPAQTAKFTVAAGASSKLAFTFLIPQDAEADTVAIEIAGRKTVFELHK